MKVWITKYALTKGLFEIEAEIIGAEGETQYASQIGPIRGSGIFTREFARTKAEAVEVAEKMRDRKIQSLKKQLAEIERMRFK